ncbi:MAG: alpha/beta fold hydrolase, partial [Candidatus Hodarchaeota archaeon]
NCKASLSKIGKVRKITVLKLEPGSTSSPPNNEILLLPLELTQEEAFEKIINFQEQVKQNIDHSRSHANSKTEPSLMQKVVKNLTKGIEVVTEKVVEFVDELTGVIDSSSGRKVQIGKFEDYIHDSQTKNVASLVFVPGVGEIHEIWDPYLKDFSRHYRAITYDLRGHGKSARPSAKKYYHFKSFVEQLSGVIESLHLQSPITLIGHSLGGCIALGYALQYPDRV